MKAGLPNPYNLANNNEVFENLEGWLAPMPAGYYREQAFLAKNALLLADKGEIFYFSDHYRQQPARIQ